MAIKDWKKTQNNPLVYTKRTDSNKWLGMRSYEGFWHTILPSGVRKKFKTKLEAEEYITSYMVRN